MLLHQPRFAPVKKDVQDNGLVETDISLHLHALTAENPPHLHPFLPGLGNSRMHRESVVVCDSQGPSKVQKAGHLRSNALSFLPLCSLALRLAVLLRGDTIKTRFDQIGQIGPLGNLNPTVTAIHEPKIES
jgi:hypothetical protein